MSQETAALICRVSTREQEEGYSLDAQENLLREFCLKNGYAAVLIHRFSETASKQASRVKFRAFMAEVVRYKVRHIIVEKVDRLSRSGLKEAVQIDDWLEENETRHVHFVKDGIDLHKFARSGDKLNWGMRVVLAKNYTDNLKEEVRKSVDAMLRKGIWPAKTPKGYIRDKSHSRSPIQPDPVRATLIQLLFDLYDSGDWSVHRLEERLFEEGYRTARGTRLKASQIHGILHDPFYMGKMLFEGKLWEGVHPPLISAEQFYRVQKRLTRPEHGEGAAPFQRHDHLFRRAVFCGGCGKALTWEIQKGRVYGACRGHKTCPARVFIRQDTLEKELLPHLTVFRLRSPRLADWLRKVLKQMNADEESRRESSRDDLEQLLARADQRLSRLLDMRIDDNISEEDFAKKRADLNQEKDLILGRLHNISEQQEDFLDNVATLIALSQDMSAQFLSATPEKKRTVVRNVFQRVTVSGSRVYVEYTELFSFLLQALKAAESSKMAILASREIPDFELEKSGSEKQKEGLSTPSHSDWWTIQNKFRTFLSNNSAWNDFFRFALAISSEDIQHVFDALSESPNALTQQSLLSDTPSSSVGIEQSIYPKVSCKSQQAQPLTSPLPPHLLPYHTPHSE
ncbi:recombinase family protein [Armatimonas rosea]|uniref:DNA invertase Pin-like site-specific DNA recombinase n=1 Tax=Armatimonas rosea TaxID=685828 RepID=A0A7W9SY88_ARMRO|nr:recombinase family protein [Armatimonas rosea]MBB6054133.1 DNA invertase Pin-like site-specific DNA recombinase [Armatimonas rosea]